jgi:hypothetical protein
VLEGRLVGPWLGELERCWRELERSGSGRKFVVDLMGVTFVDPEGKALLSQICQSGAELVATGCCMRFIVEDAKKPIPGKQVLSD